MLSLAFAIMGCSSSDDDSGSSGAYDPKSVEQTGQPVATASGNQALIPAADGSGVFAVAAQYYPEPYATLQFVAPTASEAGSANVLPNSSTYSFGTMGVQDGNGAILLPYQSFGNSYHGVETVSEDGELIADNNFATTGLTGTGAVKLHGDFAVAVVNNADYSSGFSLDANSSLIAFDPYSDGSASYTVTALSDTVNATGLAIDGDTAIVASAGDYLNGDDAGLVTKIDLTAAVNENPIRSQINAPAGLIGGNVDFSGGYALISGGGIAIYDGSKTKSPDLGDDCGEGYVLGAQFVQTGGDRVQFVFNRHDWGTPEMTVYAAEGDFETDEWSCEEIARVESGDSAAALVRYGDGAFAAATDSAVVFMTADE